MTLPTESAKLLELLAQYRKLNARKMEGLSPAEEKTLKEIEKKLAAVLDQKAATKVSEQTRDKRKDLRIHSSFEIRISTSQELDLYYLKNISGGGMYVATDQLKVVGTRVPFQLQLPDSDKVLELEGEVAWVNPKNIGQLPKGMGLKFINPPEDLKEKIEDMLEKAVKSAIKKDKEKDKKK